MHEPNPLPADARDEITAGEIAYNAYRKHCKDKEHLDLVPRAPIPQWRYLSNGTRAAWNAAGAAVASAYSQ